MAADPIAHLDTEMRWAVFFECRRTGIEVAVSAVEADNVRLAVRKAWGLLSNQSRWRLTGAEEKLT